MTPSRSSRSAAPPAPGRLRTAAYGFPRPPPPRAARRCAQRRTAPRLGSSSCRAGPWLDDLEIAAQFPIGDGLAELALLPLARRRVMLDEGVAEQLPRRSRT